MKCEVNDRVSKNVIRCMNKRVPRFLILEALYLLQSLQGHLYIVQDFIFSLKIFSDFAILISLGINSHNFGAKEDILSVPK